jgi:hypothetical protein
MYSEEYIRDLEMSAHLNRKQEKEIMLCPVCGRKIDKWIWRTTCCGAEIVWADAEDEKSIDYELGYEKGWADGYAEGMEVDEDDE